MFRVNHISAIAALLVLSGCVSNPDLGESSLGLFEPGEAMPVAEHLWQSAAEGCEDALGPDIDYREAENAPDLVVCVTPSGDIVCVDTAAAMTNIVYSKPAFSIHTLTRPKTGWARSSSA